MKKQVFGRKFKRNVNQRKALFKGLVSALVIHERIQTTEEKAKAVKGDFDKIVTKAKKGGEQAMRLVEPHLTPDAVKKMVQDIAPRFATRPGGYTRIVRLNRRFNDDASMVILELVEKGARLVSKGATTVAVAAEAKIDDAKAKKPRSEKATAGKEKKSAVKKAKPVKKEKEDKKTTKKETKK